MDGVSRAVGSPMPLEINGKTYKLFPLTIDDIGTIEQKIIRDRGSNLQDALKGIENVPESVQRMIIEEAMKLDSKSRNTATNEEVSAFIDSRMGIKFTVWLMTNKEGQELSLEDLSSWVDEMSNSAIRDLMSARDQVSSWDEAGNEIGPTSTSENSKKQSSGQESEAGPEQLTGDSQSENTAKQEKESCPGTSES